MEGAFLPAHLAGFCHTDLHQCFAKTNETKIAGKAERRHAEEKAHLTVKGWSEEDVSAIVLRTDYKQACHA